MKADNAVSDRTRPPSWLWLLIPATLFLFQSWFRALGVLTLPHSDFKQLLHAGKVSELTVAEETIRGTLKPVGLDQVLPSATLEKFKCSAERACRFATVRVADPALMKDLEASGVRFSGQVSSTWLSTLLVWALPLVLLFWLAGLMARRSGMSSGWLLDIGKSKARVYVASNSGVTFNDVAGIDEAKDELMELVAFLKDPERYRRLGGKIPKGVLIVGAPGTGKTLLAKAVAGEAGVPFFSISGSEFVEMFVGVGAARVRDLFAQAQEKAPCIIFIDELDALGRARGVAGIAGGGYNEHEHALVAEFRRNADPVAKISIIPRGIAALGYTQQLPTEEHYLLKQSELLDRLDVFLGGRVAEELAFGDVSTGAQNDLQLATDMARHMVTEYGMSEQIGLAAIEQAPAGLMYPPSASERKAYSEHTARAIDAEIARLLGEAHDRVKETLTAKRALLDALAQALLEKETVDRASLDILLKGHEAPRIRQATPLISGNAGHAIGGS